MEAAVLATKTMDGRIGEPLLDCRRGIACRVQMICENKARVTTCVEIGTARQTLVIWSRAVATCGRVAFDLGKRATVQAVAAQAGNLHTLHASQSGPAPELVASAWHLSPALIGPERHHFLSSPQRLPAVYLR